jgi:predicted DNA-binding transcriptional regulator AlpA
MITIKIKNPAALLTIVDVAELLSISTHHVYKMSRRHDFPPPIKLSTGKRAAVRFDPKDIAEYIELRKLGKKYSRKLKKS